MFDERSHRKICGQRSSNVGINYRVGSNLERERGTTQTDSPGSIQVWSTLVILCCLADVLSISGVGLYSALTSTLLSMFIIGVK